MSMTPNKDDSPFAFLRTQATRLIDLMEKCSDNELCIELVTLTLRVSYYQGFRDGVKSK